MLQRKQVGGGEGLLTLRADVNMRSKDGICHVGLQDQQGRHGKTTDRESQGRHEQ